MTREQLSQQQQEWVAQSVTAAAEVAGELNFPNWLSRILFFWSPLP